MDPETTASIATRPKRWVSDWLHTGVIDTPGQPDDVATSTTEETEPSADYSERLKNVPSPTIRGRASGLHERVTSTLAHFKALLAPVDADDRLTRANLIVDFLNDSENFLRSVAATDADEPYFELGTLLQQAATQWLHKASSWEKPVLPETHKAMARLMTITPLVHEDVSALTKALVIDGINPFEPID